MGDAFPSIVANSIKGLGYSTTKKIKIDLFKLSHHGSKYGLSPELINLIECQNFVISSDGTKGNPSKECIARLALNKKTTTNLYFNYSNEIIQDIFLKDEIEKHNFVIHYLDRSTNPYTISIIE